MQLSPPPSDKHSDAAGLADRLLAEMSTAWEQGRQVAAHELLARHPQLEQQPELAVRLIFEEVCLRQEHGLPIDYEGLLQRYPAWRSELEVMLDCHRLMQSGAPAAPLPEVGQELGEFRLLAELGRGLVGRVYLAAQPSLSDRPIVLKVTPSLGSEHLSLARLQHTYIVPLYHVQEFPAQQLRALCMPYAGGCSLARALSFLEKIPLAERTGHDVVAAIERGQVAKSPLPLKGPALQYLERVSYVEAICWIGACVADALHYAHERGLAHLDLKPSNVLLAADGQPMLLDFHLAREFIQPGKSSVRSLGGTPGYMSPEQEQALKDLQQGRDVSVTLDGRSDLFSFGLLLYECLGGTITPESTARPPLREVNPQVPRRLSDSIQKCLAHDPRHRHPDAASLAADLRRHLMGGVSRRRLNRWSGRHLLAIQAATGALAALLVGCVFILWQLVAAQTALIEGDNRLRQRGYDEAAKNYTQGLSAIAWMPGQADRKQRFHERLQGVKSTQLADQLHAVVDQLRSLQASSAFDAGGAEQVAKCRKIWASRREFLVKPGPVDNSTHERVREDLFDLALICAELTLQGAPHQLEHSARLDAIEMLEEAQREIGPSRPDQQKRALAILSAAK